MAAPPDLEAILAALAQQSATTGVKPPGPGVVPPPPSGPPPRHAISSYEPGPASHRYSGSESGRYPPDPRLPARPPYEGRRSPGWHPSYPPSRSRSRSPTRESRYAPVYREREHERERPRDWERERDSYAPSRSRDAHSPNRYYDSPRGRSPASQEYASEVILVLSHLVGLIIGRQGDTLKRVEYDTGARIQFLSSAPGDPERSCRITGTGQQRASAKKAIQSIIEDSSSLPRPKAGRFPAAPEHQDESRKTRDGSPIQMMIPDRTVGLVIGRGGETIRDLQERSGCHVNIVSESQTVNGLRPVNLTGTKEAKQHAKDLIMQIVETDTRTGPPPGPSQASNRESADKDNGPRQTMTIPSKAVGMIIGRGGDAIKRLKELTGCRIEVLPPDGANDEERQVILYGPKDCTDSAMSMIQERVDEMVQRHSERGYQGRNEYESGGGGGYGRESGPQSSSASGYRYQDGQQGQQAGPGPYGGYPAAGYPSNPYSSMPNPSDPSSGLPKEQAMTETLAVFNGLMNYPYNYQQQYSAGPAGQAGAAGGANPPLPGLDSLNKQPDLSAYYSYNSAAAANGRDGHNQAPSYDDRDDRPK